METYILKRDVHNDETFPIGTIVTEIKNSHYCFEVVEGKMKGEKGGIADGLFSADFVCEDTKENRRLISEWISIKNRMIQQLADHMKSIETIPSAISSPYPHH